MKIEKSLPPNWEKIKEAFPGVDPQTTCFTYGDTIHNPSGSNVPGHMLVHEETHERQQSAMGIDAWWDKFIADPEFRLDQELEAYRAQYKDYCANVKDRNARAKVLDYIAAALSGERYGNLLHRFQAIRLIRNEN